MLQRKRRAHMVKETASPLSSGTIGSLGLVGGAKQNSSASVANVSSSITWCAAGDAHAYREVAPAERSASTAISI
jgi:hypothetical protein